MNLSFAGCGFLGIYHIGVASCFREYAPHILVNKIAGASVGSIAAAALICRVPLGQTTTDVLRVAVQARSRTLGPLHPGFDLNSIIREGLEKALPENAHLLCSGRLFISCTRVRDGQNVLLSQYNSKEDLIQALLCSCFIPFYSGIRFPNVDGESLVDGGFSDNLPVLDENTITVSPFVGEHDICPQEESCNILQINLANTSISICPGNMYRFARILFPPHPEILNKMCQQGFDDALKFLQRHNLITCTRCMAVQSSLTLSDSCSSDKSSSNNESVAPEHAYDDCMDCRYRRQMALLDSLPEAVVAAIQEACDQVNKGVINWLFRHRPMKLLSILGLPYVLPIDISIIVFCKVWQKLPSLQKEIQSKFQNILALIKSFLQKIDTSRHLYSAKFSCQLAITEFDYTEESVSSSYALPNLEKPPQDTCHFITEQAESKAKEALKVPDFLSPATEPRHQRKSYAGFLCHKELDTDRQRRKSMCDIRQPERVLRNMKFGFTVDLKPMTVSPKKMNVADPFQSLGEEEGEINVIELTNKALNWERECIGQYHGDLEPENAETLEKILDVTANEAVMAYYYVDDDKTVKVTELYNVDDADTSAVLSQEERDANSKLQWENDWVCDPNISCCDFGNQSSGSIGDIFDDKELSLSDNERELREEDDVLPDLPGMRKTSVVDSNLESGLKENVRSVPQRKKSFIIVK